MAEHRRCVLASGNAGKLRELGNSLASLQIELIPQSDFNTVEADETGLSFIENALIKARNASHFSGLPALADDSGLSVDALNGRPGIHSARFASGVDGKKPSDADNVSHLLNLMNDVPAADRGARFVCALVWIEHPQDPEPVVATGSWSGSIARQPAGRGGFGYDPVFVLPGTDTTASQISADEKRAVGHRGQALLRLLEQLAVRLAAP